MIWKTRKEERIWRIVIPGVGFLLGWSSAGFRLDWVCVRVIY